METLICKLCDATGLVHAQDSTGHNIVSMCDCGIWQQKNDWRKDVWLWLKPEGHSQVMPWSGPNGEAVYSSVI